MLTVNHGYGTGTYAPGDTVHIWGSEPQKNTTFNTWTGNTEHRNGRSFAYQMRKHDWRTRVSTKRNASVTVKS